MELLVTTYISTVEYINRIFQGCWLTDGGLTELFPYPVSRGQQTCRADVTPCIGGIVLLPGHMPTSGVG